MKLQTLARYVIGYILGITVFFAAIPCMIFAIGNRFDGAAWSSPFGQPVQFVAPLILESIGIFFVLWSNAALLFKGRGGPTELFNVAISPRTKYLVVIGPYRYTRNPMVFGAFSCYFALAFLWNSLPAVIVSAVFFIIIRYYLKATEEKRLLKDFGQEYEEYRQRVPMIVPWGSKMKQLND